MTRVLGINPLCPAQRAPFCILFETLELVEQYGSHHGAEGFSSEGTELLIFPGCYEAVFSLRGRESPLMPSSLDGNVPCIATPPAP
jgi:hypothetical protein